MGAGALQHDRWHVSVRTIAQRNAVNPRRWGMRVTVYEDPTPANNTDYFLVYNLASTRLSDNNNWQAIAAYINGLDTLSDVEVDTSGDPVTLNMANFKQRVFFGSVPIQANTSLVMSQDGNALMYWFTFLCDQNIEIQMPADFKMVFADSQWDPDTKIWTALGVGPTEYVMKAVYGIDAWMITIEGPMS
jgi:hypothetical protein